MCWQKPASLYKYLTLAIFSLLILPVFAADPQSNPELEGVASDLSSAASDDDSDWDWSGITAEDTTPAEVDSKPVLPTPGTRLRDTTIASPDYSASTKPAMAIFTNMPTFEVIPSQKNAEMHPCSNCHQWTKGDTSPRILKRPHDDFELKHGLHGKGKFWCMTCHHLEGSGGLVTLEGEKIDFDDAYLICSQCHVNQARDWVYGAHGKRIGNWQGTRQILNCTACHYQHAPAHKPRAPMEGPVIRMGLERPEHWKPLGRGAGDNGHHHQEVWQ